MAFSDLFLSYPNRNPELRKIIRRCYEFGKTISQSQSAAATNGLDAHTLDRQREYTEWVDNEIRTVSDNPIPDMPATHPIDFPIDLADPYATFVEGLDGQQRPLNEDAQFIAESWMLLAVELARSNSAAIAGGMTVHDSRRALANVEAIDKHLSALSSQDALDLPETASPAAPLQSRRKGGV